MKTKKNGEKVENKEPKKEPRHCDTYINDKTQPICLRNFLRFNRWPAWWQLKAVKKGVKEPTLFATHRGTRVKVNMASRFGDVGITTDLEALCGYDIRVSVENLSLFSVDKNLYIVRQWDMFDGWIDITQEVTKEEADVCWNKYTQNGTKQTKYSDGDYYAIFPGGTRMIVTPEFLGR